MHEFALGEAGVMHLAWTGSLCRYAHSHVWYMSLLCLSFSTTLVLTNTKKKINKKNKKM